MIQAREYVHLVLFHVAFEKDIAVDTFDSQNQLEN